MNAWAALAILILLILTIQYAPRFFSADCPKHSYGNGMRHFKYFSSPFCIACWIQKPIIEKVAVGSNVTFDEYDVDSCRDAAAPHYIRGIPSFIINDTIVYGLQTEEQLRALIA